MGRWGGAVEELPKIMPKWSPQTYQILSGVALGAFPVMAVSSEVAPIVTKVMIGVGAMGWFLWGGDEIAIGVVGGAIGTYIVRNVLGSV